MNDIDRLNSLRAASDRYRAGSWFHQPSSDVAFLLWNIDRLIEQLEATQARAAAAEARIERFLAVDWPATDDLALLDERVLGALHAAIRGVQATRSLTQSDFVLSDFAARFPETDEHRRINDEAAAQALADDDVPACSRCGKEDACYAGGLCYFCAGEDSFGTSA